MNKKLRSEIGKVYGMLTILREDSPHRYPSGFSRRRFICRCECGNEKSIVISNIRNGNTTSCGCGHAERARLMKYSHGLSKHPLNGLWRNIKSRCYNVNSDFYNNYGGKGIVMCYEWSSNFKAFYDWCMSNGYAKGMSIERKDISKGYNPSNCCFIPLKDQANNRTNTQWIDICGTRKNATQWANEIGINRNTVLQRLNKGLSPYEALGIW